MNANEVDVGDEVLIIKGDWAGQKGNVQTRCDLLPDGTNSQKSLLLIRLVKFGRIVHKSNFDVEKTTNP